MTGSAGYSDLLCPCPLFLNAPSVTCHWMSSTAVRRKGGSAAADTAPPADVTDAASPEDVAAAKSTARAFNNVLIFSVLMSLVPVCSFFLSNSGYLDPVYRVTIGVPSDQKRSIYSGVLAIFLVNFVVLGFILTAFNEEPVPVKKQK